MSIIPDLPEFVISMINGHLQAVLLWFSEYVSNNGARFGKVARPTGRLAVV